MLIWGIIMSTNTNGGLPDIAEIEKLANQFFRALPGNSLNDASAQRDLQNLAPAGDSSQGSIYTDNDLLKISSPESPDKYAPLSGPVAGSGISPSAINQGNAVNLQDPQTSFADPGLNASKQPAAPVSGGGIPPSKAGLPVQPTAGISDYFEYPGFPGYRDAPQTFPVTGYAAPVPQNLSQLPYQQEQPFETELREILNKVNSSVPSPQIPFSGLPAADVNAYYFLNDNHHPASSSVKLDNSDKAGLSGFMPPFDINLVRRDFPILQEYVKGKPLIWLDNAATTQKPRQVIERLTYFYEHENSNIHRAAHELAARATDAYEGARKKVQAFLNAGSVNEIVFVRGATEAINLVAKTWGEQKLEAGDEIIVSHLEHHANIVPWQQLAAKKGLKIRVIPVDDDGQILLDEYARLLGPKTKLVAFTQVSNALGTVTPAAQIVQMAHSAGAKVLIDGAQSVSHMRVDVKALNADWFVFSGHKVFGPTGIGVLYGKEALLNETQPWQGGGNMIVDVTFEHTQYQNAPGRFEAGTGNIADAVGLGAAIDYVTRLGMDAIAQYEHYLLVYATGLLKEVPGLRLIGTAPEKASVLSFVLDGYKTEEVGSELNKEGIAVRSGHHCAQPILRRFGFESTVRPSLAFYNTCAEVDILVDTLRRLKREGRRL